MLEAPSTGAITWLMQKFRGGDRDAVERLVELCYLQLRRMAANRMQRKRIEHTWQPTVLINELYLELTKVKSLARGEGGEEQELSAFLGLCGHSRSV